MNKNLKKVISAVGAIAISASSVAAFAVDFPDVDATANYAQAVKELSALNIISGYEDGTFKPENLVTRAEISKMIVDALAETSSAEASKTSTKFADVQDHWATGYINQGVADGWISGHSDTQFAPDDNVTFVQAQKMLVAAIGYDTYAQAQGGWPSGYKLYASTKGITKGISGVSDDTQLTRAQVAQMIDNAMDAPLCLIVDWKTEWNGIKTPVLEVKDGEGKEYQTLFTNKHDAYKVYGRVTETNKTNSTLETDKVNFQVEKADNFDDQYVKSSEPLDPEEMYVGESKADEYLRTYAQALIQKNDDDEYTIISLTAAAANKSVTVASEDIDDGKTDLSKNVLYFYPAGTTRNSVKYELADSVDYYVNGVSMGTFDEDALQKYIIDNDTASVTLQKETNIGTTSSSSKYNVIMISTYATAVVDEVVEKSTQTVINFKEQSTGLKTNLKVEKDDDTYTYNFTLDGAAIAPEDLQEDDVLNIAYDMGTNFADSTFYDVIVTRNVVEGVKCTGVNSDGDEFTIGGTKYKVAQGISLVPETSTTYNLYLDHFGRIAAVDEDYTTKNFGILKNVYTKANGDTMAEVITKEGTEEEYKVDTKNVDAYKALLKNTDSKIADYPEQVIDYSVSTSTNKITIKSKDASGAAAAISGTKATDAEYKVSSGKIGSVRISDATIIMDISNVDKKDDYKVVSKDNLVDGQEYTVYGYDKSSSDSAYRFVLITDGVGGVNSTTPFAIFNGSEIVEDGDDEKTAFNLVVNGEEIQLMVDEDYSAPALQEGDAIVYAQNAAGYIDAVYTVFEKTNLLNGTSFANFKNDAFAGNVALSTDLALDDKGVSNLLSDSNDDVEVVFGPVIDKNGSDITIGKVTKDGDKYITNLATGSTLTVDGDTKIYTYDYSINSSKSSRVVLDNGVQVTPVTRASHVNGDINNDNIIINHEDIGDSVVFAVARVINDDVQEIYLIVNEG